MGFVTGKRLSGYVFFFSKHGTMASPVIWKERSLLASSVVQRVKRHPVHLLTGDIHVC